MNDYLQQTRDIVPNHGHFTAAVTGLKPHPSVLIAENNSVNRQDLKELLDLYNIRVFEADNGEEAIELTLQKCPDLVLLNTELPELDGYAAAKTIRNIRSLDKVPIVFFSAETDRAFRKRAFAVGGNSFHIAPLDLERLDHILEHFLFRVI